MNSILEFPVRPDYQAGESLAGYLYRLHSDNGHAISGRTATLVKHLYDTDITKFDPHACAQIQRLVGHERMLDVASWVDGWRQVQELTPRWQRQWLKCGQFLICPKCIDARGLHLALWELPQITACSIHRCELATRCERCSRRLSWSHLDLDWRCFCGQPLRLMHTKLAVGPSRMLAEHVCRAQDVPMPCDYPVSPIESLRHEPLNLEMTYRLLQCFHGLRRVVVDAIGAGRSPNEICKWYESRARRYPHRWECALLARWPEGLHMALLRLTKRACPVADSTFVAVQQCSPIRYGLVHLVGDGVVGCKVEPLRQAVAELINQFRAPFQIYGLVLFNPRLLPEQRQRRMLRFESWWRDFRRALPCIESARKCQIQTFYNYPTSSERKEALVVSIVNRIVAFADAGVEPSLCSPIFEVWCSAPLARDTVALESLIAAISISLMQLPQGSLETMLRLADQIRMDTGP